jgi:subtilisin family serine protease
MLGFDGAGGEPASVAWLPGLQRQASHLGMGAGTRDETAMAWTPGGEPSSLFGLGITRVVKTIPVLGRSVRDVLGTPLAWIAGEDGEDLGGGPGGTAGAPRKGFVNAAFTGVSGERVRTVSALPGAERRGVSASADPCPNEACFGRSLIKWHASLAQCTKDVRIGVIDTSFDLSHPAFKRLRVVRKEFIEGVQASDDDWHGTAILSLLAGDPDSGTPGLVPDATFLLATAFRSDAAGNATTDPERLLEALNWLDQLDVDVVNMSFAGPPDPAIARVIERMSLKGVMFVAAAGNMGPTAPASYPGAYPHVIAVTAVNRDGENYRSANRGSYIDIAAPGVDILTALPNGKQGLQTGTSFAVPFVTAILATRAASGIVEGTEELLLERIGTRDLGAPGRDPVYGVGLALAPAQCQGASLVAQTSGAGAKKAKPQKSRKAMRAGIADLRW